MTQDKDPSNWSKDWISAGGILGAAILLSKLTRMPLAVIIGAVPLLLPYLRRSEQKAQGAGQPRMTRDEAALILGLRKNATQDEVRDAHRRLIQKNHPDQGGSDYLAAKINQARDVLLGKG